MSSFLDVESWACDVSKIFFAVTVSFYLSVDFGMLTRTFTCLIVISEGGKDIQEKKLCCTKKSLSAKLSD